MWTTGTFERDWRAQPWGGVATWGVLINIHISIVELCTARVPHHKFWWETIEPQMIQLSQIALGDSMLWHRYCAAMCNRLWPLKQGVGHSQQGIRVSNYSLQKSKYSKMHTKVNLVTHWNHNAIPMAKNMCVQINRLLYFYEFSY